MRIFLLWLLWLLSKIQICYFIFLLSGSNVASMSSFSFLEGVILTIPGGSVAEAMWWVGWSENWGIRLSFSPVQLKLSFGWAWQLVAAKTSSPFRFFTTPYPLYLGISNRSREHITFYFIWTRLPPLWINAWSPVTARILMIFACSLREGFNKKTLKVMEFSILVYPFSITFFGEKKCFLL